MAMEAYGGFNIYDDCDQCKRKSELFTTHSDNIYLCHDCLEDVSCVALSKREISTIFAALSYWQSGIEVDEEGVLDVSVPEAHAPITLKEINHLYERLMP